MTLDDILSFFKCILFNFKLSLLGSKFKVFSNYTWVSGRKIDKEADSNAVNANMLIGILGDTSASLPTVVAST